MHHKTPKGTVYIDMHIWQYCNHLFRSFDKSKYTLKFNIMNDLHWHNCFFATCFPKTKQDAKMCFTNFVGEELPWPP